MPAAEVVCAQAHFLGSAAFNWVAFWKFHRRPITIGSKQVMGQRQSQQNKSAAADSNSQRCDLTTEEIPIIDDPQPNVRGHNNRSLCEKY